MVDFERICSAYESCNEKKSGKQTSLEFGFALVLRELQRLTDDINERRYEHGDSTCFVIPYPTPREVFAAKYRDRVVQTFFCEEIQPALDEVLLPSTTSCRVGKGTDYALKLLKGYVAEATRNGTEDAYYIKIDLSGFFMSIRRQRLADLMAALIAEHYHGEYKDDLLYLAPIIYLDNPATHAILHSPPELWATVPKRKQLDPNGDCGIAIGNITAQHGSNLNLDCIDHYCVEDLDLPMYVRYVDDIIIVDRCVLRLRHDLPLITDKLSSIGMTVNSGKTRIDTVYHGVKFLGKVTYPYGYQCSAKEPAGRVIKHAREMRVDEHMISRLNSQIGRLKNYACYNLIHDYMAALPDEVWEYAVYDDDKQKFIQTKEIIQHENLDTKGWFCFKP